MDKETIAEVFQGLTGLVAVGVAAAIVLTEAQNTAAMTFAMALAGPVVAMYFQQRATTKAVNGNLTAMGNIANQVSSARDQAAATATDTAVRVAEATSGHPATTVPAPAVVIAPPNGG
jgi:hypothetical protein